MDATVSEDMKLCVKRGAAWMDENYPGWIASIDLSKLDMNDCHCCVIGQTIGNYYNVFINETMYEESWAEDHGFETDKDYCKLDIAWTDYIYDRLDNLV